MAYSVCTKYDALIYTWFNREVVEIESNRSSCILPISSIHHISSMGKIKKKSSEVTRNLTCPGLIAVYETEIFLFPISVHCETFTHSNSAIIPWAQQYLVVRLAGRGRGGHCCRLPPRIVGWLIIFALVPQPLVSLYTTEKYRAESKTHILLVQVLLAATGSDWRT